MLNELVVDSLGVIDHAELAPGPGSNTLTGETGAGKTLVVAALSLLLGGRADRGLIREGSSEARVEGRFTLPDDHPAVTLLRAAGMVDEEPAGEIEVLVARVVSADGRAGKVRINGRLATVALLSEIGSALAEIAGQHEHQRLNSAAAQREILDRFAGPDAHQLALEVTEAVRAAARTRRRLEELKAGERERRRELDVLEFEIKEIGSAELASGESARLSFEARRLEHAEALAEGLSGATDVIKGEDGAIERLAEAIGTLRSLVDFDPGLAESITRLESAAVEIEDVAEDLAARVVDADPATLAASRERLDQIARLKRKYGDDEDEILAYLERAQARSAELESAGLSLESGEKELKELEDRAADLAAKLTKTRKKAGGHLETEVEGLLRTLALPEARFEVALESRELYEGGAESVELRVAANPGEAPRAVSKVASGGELSRIALALHLLTKNTTSSPSPVAHRSTLVFDEVDAGVGGAAAQAVGKALGELGTGGQVIVVTHLPQVAAYADRHFTIQKSTRDERAISDVTEVAGEERVEELSRMLSGLPESERAREHAQELLEISEAAR
ncbi:MAG: DNA repair protein RecN [Actinobacteria bacterium]|nr:DNA repair protein RecN [Actinomycetota bacterium]